MKTLYIFLTVTFLCSFLGTPLALALDYYQVTKNQANVRVDSNALSDSLGFIVKDDKVEVVAEKFDWYRIVLPKNFPCYIFKNLTENLEGKAIRVTATKVNLRSGPSLESPVIGQAPKLEVFPLLESAGEWLKIENNSYAKGWVHKNFLDKRPSIEGLASAEAKLTSSDEAVIYQTIGVLTQIGGDNPELIAGFLKKAENSSIREASIYLDVLQNIIQPEFGKKAYFYQFQNNSLSSQDVNEALGLFQKLTVN